MKPCLWLRRRSIRGVNSSQYHRGDKISIIIFGSPGCWALAGWLADWLSRKRCSNCNKTKSERFFGKEEAETELYSGICYNFSRRFIALSNFFRTTPNSPAITPSPTTSHHPSLPPPAVHRWPTDRLDIDAPPRSRRRGRGLKMEWNKKWRSSRHFPL